MITETVIEERIIRLRFQTVLILLTVTDDDDDIGDNVVKLLSLTL